MEDPEIKFMSFESQFSGLTFNFRVSLFPIEIKFLISFCIKAHIVTESLFHGLQSVHYRTFSVTALMQFMGKKYSQENVKCSLAPCNAV